MGMTPFEVLDDGNVHMEDRENKFSSHELITTKPYQPFSWDEGNVVAYVYQTMSSHFSSSFLISREASCSINHVPIIVDTSGYHHCFEIIYHALVETSPCRSFVSTNLSQVDGYLRYESKEACWDNEALWSMSMVMPGPYYFVLFSRKNKFISMKTLSPRTLYIKSMHVSHLACYFPSNAFHQLYDRSAIFYDRIEAWLDRSY